MLSITILAVGKLKESYWREASAEYIKRLSAFCKMEVVELPEYRLSDNPSPAEIARCIQKEGEEILAKVPRDGYFIPLCVEGKEISFRGAGGKAAAAAGGRGEPAGLRNRRLLRAVGCGQGERAA